MSRFALVLPLLAGLILAVTSVGLAQSGPAMRDGWIRHLPGDGPLAGYLTLVNPGPQVLELRAVRSPDFDAVHLHTTVEEDGRVVMRPLESLTVPPGGEVRLAPGGHHLMLMRRQRPLSVGDQVEITLEFTDGRTLTIPMPVEPAYTR
ncbi:MAG: copper chaperone PCu(A)C [Candidatus Competibacterales bacterium]|nr:copper chaperone PCu(A)C [Candidatus Competibacterales bacterium]